MAPPDSPFDDDPPEGTGGEHPLGDWPLIGDLTRLLGSPAVSRQAAEQLAVAVASDNRTEANATPADRIGFAELAGLAQLAAESLTGLPITPDRRPVDVTVVNRSGWALQTLRDWRPLFQQLRDGLAAAGEEPDDSEPHAGTQDALLRRLMEPLTPLMCDMTAGSLTGRLARVALGSYDVMLPRVRSDRLLLVAPNITAFAREWSLSRDDTCLWVCLHSLTCGAVLGVPHVHRRLTELLGRYARGFEIRPEGIAESLQEQLGDLDPEQAMSEVPKLLTSPEMMLGAVRSDHQEALETELATLLAVVTGYVDAMTDQACGQMLGAHSPVREAFRRRRLTPPIESRHLGRLLGAEVSGAVSDRGARFIEGVVERAGTEGLGRLWQAAENWPTPNEIDAAGLWLARLDLYGDSGEPDPGP